MMEPGLAIRVEGGVSDNSCRSSPPLNHYASEAGPSCTLATLIKDMLLGLEIYFLHMQIIKPSYLHRRWR